MNAAGEGGSEREMLDSGDDGLVSGEGARRPFPLSKTGIGDGDLVGGGAGIGAGAGGGAWKQDSWLVPKWRSFR